MTYHVQIKVMPLKDLLDPQGKAVLGGLHNLGLNGVSDVRVGKHITLQIEAASETDAKVQQVQSQSEQENRAINAFKNRFTDASFSWGQNAEQSKIIFKKIDYDQSGKVTVSGFVTIARNDRPMNKEDVMSWSELYKNRIGKAVDRALGYSFSKDMTDGPSFGEEFLFSHIKQNYKFHSPFHKTTNFKIGVNETEKLNQNPSLNSVAIPFSITVSH
jgi:phosphoribosylformylglycinamidine synthase PurS subunit